MGNTTTQQRPLVNLIFIRVKAKPKVNETKIASYAFEMAKSGIFIYVNNKKSKEATGFNLYLKECQSKDPSLDKKTIKNMWKYLPTNIKKDWKEMVFTIPNVYTGFGFYMKHKHRELKMRYPKWSYDTIMQQIWNDWRSLSSILKNEWKDKAKRGEWKYKYYV